MSNQHSLAEYAADFELWARECVHIIDKLSCCPVPFILNAPQRKVLAVLEEQRRARRPMRMILLKARQWGGSTLVQVYMAWLQLVHRRGWNSVVCAHVKDASAGIRGMYSRLLRDYPPELKSGAAKDWDLAPYERSSSILYLPARDCQLALATSLSPNAVRGSNFAMAHLSEVAFWGDGDKALASQIVRTVSGSVPLQPDTLVVMESTANGRDNFFFEEWQRAVAGKSDKVPVFVAWHEIDIYRCAVAEEERQELLDALDDYERALLESGVALESVAWYHRKRREYASHEEMMAEFPSTPEEAFATSGSAVFGSHDMADAADTALLEGLHERLVVFQPGSGRRKGLMTLVAFDTRRLCAFWDREVPGDVAEAWRELREVVLAEHARVLVLDTQEAGEMNHAVWFARRVLREGFHRQYVGERDGVMHLTGTKLCEAVDLWSEGVREGRVYDASGMTAEELEAFSLGSPAGHPRVAARLAAAWLRLRSWPGVRIGSLAELDPLLSAEPLRESTRTSPLELLTQRLWPTMPL